MYDMARLRRWARFRDRDSGRALIVPIDHGLTMGPIPGLQGPQDVLRWLSADVLTGVVVHKGMAERLGAISGCGMMVHLNGTAAFDDCPDMKTLVTSVEAAVRLGADGVSIQTNFTGATAAHNLRLLGQVVDQAHDYGLPVMAMVYDKSTRAGDGVERLRHCMRMAIELGVDVLKVPLPQNQRQIPDILYGTLPHTPVLFAGGSLMSDEMLVAMIETVIKCGATGICVGRNVFQRPNPRATLEHLMKVLKHRTPSAVGVDEASVAYFEPA